MDDEDPKPKAHYIIGMNLELMSVEALNEYLRAMEEEAARVNAEVAARGEHRAAAEALFS